MNAKVTTQTQAQDARISDVVGLIGKTPAEVLANYKSIWDQHLHHVDSKKLIAAKNLVLRNLVSEQMREQRYFEIISPFGDKTCQRCHGAGEIYKFNKKSVLVNCHVCDDNGKVMAKCPEQYCVDGRYIREFPDGGSINVQCRTCKGTSLAEVTCMNCRGKKKVRKIITTHLIQSTTPCPYCDERGFDPHELKSEKKESKRIQLPENPVITKEQAVNLTIGLANAVKSGFAK